MVPSRTADAVIACDHSRLQAFGFTGHRNMLDNCECRTAPVQLAAYGLFPCSPVNPQLAVSFELVSELLCCGQRLGPAHFSGEKRWMWVATFSSLKKH
jgi:hypothetical protein